MVNLIEWRIHLEDPTFKVGDHVSISKYKNIFAKGHTPNWSEEIFVIKKLKNNALWTYANNWQRNCWSFLWKGLQKTNQEKIRIEDIIKRNVDKLYVKWKGYGSSFNSWIDKKDLT